MFYRNVDFAACLFLGICSTKSSTVKMEAVSSSETSLLFCRIIGASLIICVSYNSATKIDSVYSFEMSINFYHNSVCFFLFLLSDTEGGGGGGGSRFLRNVGLLRSYCVLLASYLLYLSTLLMEAVFSSETLVYLYEFCATCPLLGIRLTNFTTMKKEAVHLSETSVYLNRTLDACFSLITCVINYSMWRWQLFVPWKPKCIHTEFLFPASCYLHTCPTFRP
jgi:hypothetical protein